MSPAADHLSGGRNAGPEGRGGAPVDVTAIEREMAELWMRMTSPSSEGVGQAITRACVLNLVVYAEGEERAGEVGQIIAQVTESQPGRVILVLPRPATGPLEAVVTAQCHRTGRGGRQICCEQVLIRGAEEEMSHLASLVQPLLVPDLPVFLWWRQRPDPENPLLGRLARASDRVLFDSGLLPRAAEQLPGLGAWILQFAGSASFGDMSWSQLTPWRTLVSSFFDREGCRACLADLEEVEIEWTGSRSIPSQALLLSAWLASRLRWELAVSRVGEGDQATVWEMRGGRERLRIRFCWSDREAGTRDVLRQVRLSTGGGRRSDFRVFLHDDGRHLETRATWEGAQLTPRLMRLEGRDEAGLLEEELGIPGRDSVYEQALRFLGALDLDEGDA